MFTVHFTSLYLAFVFFSYNNNMKDKGKDTYMAITGDCGL